MPETATKHQAEIKEPEKPYKFGRPTLYKPKLCQHLIDFFSTPPYENLPIDHYDKEGNITWTDQKRVPNDIPSLTAFCKQYKLGWTTVHEWIDANQPNYRPDFANAYTHARAIRQDFLCNGAWNNVCQANTFKFIAINLTDMRDKQEVEHSAKNSIAGLIQEAAQEKAREVKQIASTVIQNPLDAINNAENDSGVVSISETLGNKEHTQ